MSIYLALTDDCLSQLSETPTFSELYLQSIWQDKLAVMIQVMLESRHQYAYHPAFLIQ
jgi:hypothetical protein